MLQHILVYVLMSGVRSRSPKPQPKAGVGTDDGLDVLLKRSSELHGIMRSVGEGFLINLGERVVRNEPGPAFLLGDNAGRAET